MRTRYPPLVRCDVDGCPCLVEPHVCRCRDHARQLGASPSETGPRGASLAGLFEHRARKRNRKRKAKP